MSVWFSSFSRTCLQQNKLEVATLYFEKAADAVISSEGNTAPELIQLYEEVAQTEQLKKNCDRAISYLLQQAYTLLKDILKCKADAHEDQTEKVVELYLIMGSICLADRRIQEAYQLFSKSLQIQMVVDGPQHVKAKEMQGLLSMLERFPIVCKGNRLVK
ncbi:tetratricopeptide repeat protein 23-like [Apteryx rowi]|uniref:tetratricopeptide repeat protein 23-like n=1 Tax=Apteryx rowi TaxID=308060 RepID=UPI000E1C4072|nr:tetratricopeptide repeat protein 23-like [Apteryx rowi]